jgi:hypothetical protein
VDLAQNFVFSVISGNSLLTVGLTQKIGQSIHFQQNITQD